MPRQEKEHYYNPTRLQENLESYKPSNRKKQNQLKQPTILEAVIKFISKKMLEVLVLAGTAAVGMWGLNIAAQKALKNIGENAIAKQQKFQQKIAQQQNEIRIRTPAEVTQRTNESAVSTKLQININSSKNDECDNADTSLTYRFKFCLKKEADIRKWFTVELTVIFINLSSYLTCHNETEFSLDNL